MLSRACMRDGTLNESESEYNLLSDRVCRIIHSACLDNAMMHMGHSPVRPALPIHDRGILEGNMLPGGPVADVEPLNHNVNV